MRHISLYLDKPCGWRSYLVIKEGRKLALLISTENADSFKVPIAILSTSRPLPFKKTRAARHLRALARTYGVDSVALKEALAQLR